MDPLKKSNASCLKRKPTDDCLAKDSKSLRVEENVSSARVHNRSSSDSPPPSCCSRPNLANDCVNYLKSGAPSRFVFYKQGLWCDFPEEIVKPLVDAFKGGKSSVVVVMDDEALLVDFLSMTSVNLQTRKQRSVAWLDETNKWFFPSSFFDEGVDESAKLGMGIVEGGARGFVGDKVMKYPSDVVNEAILEASPPVAQNSCALDILRKKIVHVERGSESFLFVQNIFLSGMGSFAMPNNILHIHRYSPKDITAQCRLEAFERLMRLTTEKFGNPNARYGWLGSTKQGIISVIVNGFASSGKTTHNTDIGAGIYLSPENRAFTSVGLCDVDEKGVQYMLLCRAILGNTEVTKPGSQEEFLGIYDSGAGNCSNPNYYVMCPPHQSTHISLEYLISFRLAPKVQEYLHGLKGLWLCPPPTEVTMDLSTLQPVMCQTDKGPTSPWVSFRVLFEMIQDNISSLARKLLYHHYEELKENKITRKEMVKKMMIVVGEKLLVDSLTKLKYNPSLWYNSPAKTANYPASTKLESISIVTRSTDTISATTRHDCPAPIVLHQKREPMDSTFGGSLATNAAFKGKHSPTPSMCSESSQSHCTNSQDPFAPTVAPLGHNALVRSALLSVNARDSVGSSMESNGHDPLALSSSKSHDSHASRPILGNSASPSMKSLHSIAPSMTPEADELLVTSREHENSSSPDAHGIGPATSSIACQVYVPSMVPVLCAPSMAPHLCASRSMAPHPCAPKSMSPHLRMLSKLPKVHGKSTMPEANCSSAATMVPVFRRPPSSIVLPKGSGFLASSKEYLTPSVILQGPDCAANSAPELRNTPNQKNVVPKNPTSQCGANKKFPGQGVEADNTVAQAAGTLVVLSANSGEGM